MTHRFLLYSLLVFLLATTWSCVDQKFDEPPVGETPTLMPNATVADLLARFKGSDDELIQDDLIVDAVVVADDESGNFYKQLVVQDETGGLAVRLNGVGLYNEYPTGTQIFIKAKGLYISQFNGLPQLNGAPGEPIEELLIPDHLIAGEKNQPITPTLVTLAELSDPQRYRQLLNTLIQLEDVQFATADAGKSYADAANLLSLNRTVEDCAGNSIILRSSGYANFAAQVTPQGRGSLTAVLGIFRDDTQLLLRDLNDVQLDGPRCGTSGGGGGGNTSLLSISDLRQLYQGNTTKVPAGKVIRGVVISDRTTNHMASRNLVIQDGAAGIAVRFTADNTFNLGDAVEINIGDQELSEFNGLLQLNNVPLANAKVYGDGNLSSPTPRSVTVQELLAHAEAWESTLVKITNAGLAGGGTYSGSINLSDGTGTIVLFTRSQANFATQALPTTPVTVTGIVSDFNAPQLSIRSLEDVK